MIHIKMPYLLMCLLCLHAQTIYAQPINKPGGSITGSLDAGVLNEVSGVAVSKLHKKIMYVHNDSGDSSRFFAINSTGALVSTYHFNGAANNKRGVRDCEDIAVGPGPVKKKSYIYLADIGDNAGWRTKLQVYRFIEPRVLKSADTITADVVELEYPDGAKDAETIMIDPVEKMLYIVSKREDSAGIYRCPLLFKNNDKVMLEFCSKVYLDGKGHAKWVVSGDISADGKQVILKTLEHVYYWKRNGNEPIYTAMRRNPVLQHAYTVHGQEEAIAFAGDGKGYYVLSEGAGSKLYYYPLQKK